MRERSYINAFVAQSELYFCRQFQQAGGSWPRWRVFAYTFAEAFLRQLVLVDQFLNVGAISMAFRSSR